MDAKITKKRLSGMLTYDWLKIVGVALAAIIVWMLILTMTATRITPAQQFTVYNYYCNNHFGNAFLNSYYDAIGNDVFSYEVIETEKYDLSENPDYAHTMLQGYTAVDMGDILFVPGINDPDTKYTNTAGENAYLSYAESFLSGYGSFMYELDNPSEKEGKRGYFQDMEAYLNGYFGGDYKTGTLDQAKVESDFVARIRKNNDKRFKTDGQIAQGKTDDVKRIRKYRQALVDFYGYLNDGVVEFVELSTAKDNGVKNPYVQSGKYALNLCPTKKAGKEYAFDYDHYAEKLATYVSYKKEVEGEETPPDTAENMYAMFFDYAGVKEGFQYESLLYINTLIADCLK